MERLVRRNSYKHIHQVMNDLEQFYTLSSEGCMPKSIVLPKFDNSFLELQNIYNEYGWCDLKFEFCDKHYDSIQIDFESGKNILVAFSGGKDSTAVAVKYKEAGYNVILYHVHGINRTYKDEVERAKEIAEYLDLPLIIEDVKLDGKRNENWIGIPFRNIFIANMMLTYGIENKLTTQLAFGTFLDDNEYIAFDVDIADDTIMWKAYETIMQKVLPDFSVNLLIHKYTDSIEIIAKDKHLLELTQSCLGPYRFREHLHKKNCDKFKIQLLPHRCGSCAKDCSEYIYLTDHDLMPYNEAYYKHCLKIMRDHIRWERNIELETFKDVWLYFMPYDIEQSKYFGGK